MMIDLFMHLFYDWVLISNLRTNFRQSLSSFFSFTFSDLKNVSGLNYPSEILSQDTQDRGEKFLRKVVKRYNRDHPEEMGEPGWYRYGSADRDLEMIERALKNSFVETENGGLVYVSDARPNYY